MRIVGAASSRLSYRILTYPSDPLVFQWLTKNPDLCGDVLFVDVDYPELMAKKCEIILQNPQLRKILEPIDAPSVNSLVILRSHHFLAIGCDLTDPEKLSHTLANDVDFKRCLVMCTAEVSITYMDVQAADRLLEWAARYEDSTFSGHAVQIVPPLIESSPICLARAIPPRRS